MNLRKISLSPFSMKIETGIKIEMLSWFLAREFPEYQSRQLLDALEVFSENAIIITEDLEKGNSTESKKFWKE